jgi:uncharacterized YccA/Bax inhibitor family protein
VQRQSSNPVLTRLRPDSAAAEPGYGYPLNDGEYSNVVVSAGTDRMTIDDVVVKTVTLLGIVAVTGGLTWALLPRENSLPVLIGSAILGLVLGLVNSFSKTVRPALIVAYAVVEGVFLGIISRFFEDFYNGIVLQAALGTFGVFFVMAALYKAKVIRATPKFTKYLIAAMGGIVVLLLGNLLLGLFGVQTGIREAGPLGIGISIVIIVVAALSFILDFAMIEEGVRQGAPRKFAWLAAFGLLVGLIWLYIEILRLLSYLRGDD